MQTSVTFKNLDPSENLKAYVSSKLNRFDKYLDNPAEANVVLSVEKFRHIAEINLTGDRMAVIGKEETEDMYSAIDMALDKLEKQIKKNREKVRSRRSSARASLKEMAAEGQFSSEEREPRIRIKNIDYKPMDIEEAAMQMDLIDDSFLVFTNARTNRVNVLYRRRDGDYGLIQPRK